MATQTTGLEAVREALRRRLRSQRPPGSVYRLQLSRAFPLARAEEAVPYLRRLGVEAVYLSPVFKAVPGSAHGYDVVDPNEISPELGGLEAFERFCARLKRERMGLILDIVPNHCGITGDHNPFWQDVLENGPGSRYAPFFDIDWGEDDSTSSSRKRELRGKVLLPVLGDLYGRVLEQGGFGLEFDAGRFFVRWAGGRLPVNAAGRALLVEGPSDERHLHSLWRRSHAFREHVAEVCRAYAEPGRMHALLERQFYRLAHWKVASDELNYRRFFNINELAAVRCEVPEVFDAWHRLVFKLVAAGTVQGLRVDHPDGLYDPPGYFARLQEQALGPEFAEVLREPEFAGERPLYVVVEKILDRKETLRGDWRVHGSVGYDFLNLLNGVYVDRSNEAAVDAVYRDFTGLSIDFGELTYDAKKRFARVQMYSEIQALGARLDAISESDPRYRDFTRVSLTQALSEVIDYFPVYRTYISPQAKEPDPRDETYIRVAVERAKAGNPQLQPEVFDFLRDVLLLKLEPENPRYRDFVLRFQQLTAPVMAKGLEDTAFYIDHRLLSLNEVGGDPAHFGVSAGDFHQHNVERNKKWPASLLATSTHDTKRSEDVRHRINVLSELPEEWRSEVQRWALVNDKFKTELRGLREPRRNTEYFLYQTLIGVWPDEGELDAERLWSVALKSIREAKQRTDWARPDPEYEEAVRRFLLAVLEGKHFAPFARKCAAYGQLNSLSALALKLGAPGVVDTYQGNEDFRYDLVDPDNRRPVDFEALAASPSKKARLLARGLELRRRWPKLFVGGEYAPVKASGPREEHVIAYLRRDGKRAALAAGARFFTRLGPWEGTSLELPDWAQERRWVDVFTGRRHGPGPLQAEPLFADLPGALLIDED